jgi:hypothetical protein
MLAPSTIKGKKFIWAQALRPYITCIIVLQSVMINDGVGILILGELSKEKVFVILHYENRS